MRGDGQMVSSHEVYLLISRHLPISSRFCLVLPTVGRTPSPAKTVPARAVRNRIATALFSIHPVPVSRQAPADPDATALGMPLAI